MINYRLKLSDETIEEAELLIQNGKLRGAMNRIYYAIFYSVSALGLKYNFQTSKNEQLIGWFNHEFIKTGMLEKEVGKILRKAFEKRKTGDYDDLAIITKEEVANIFVQVKSAIREISKHCHLLDQDEKEK